MYRKIPKVDKVLEWPGVKGLFADHPRQVVVTAVRLALESLRAAIGRGETDVASFAEEAVLQLITRELNKTQAPALRRVINGTGVVIHTNLGRAPLAEAVLEDVCAAAFGYSTLEFDLEKGERGSRSARIEERLRDLTGAEAAVLVNNNAAAVLLALTSLAKGREVIASRGELVEIGGSFRIPEVMLQSGALLREVGATNKTHPRDYRSAVNEATALLLKVHTSNFTMIGFTSDVPVAELAAIGGETHVPVMVDAGSGNLVDLAACGITGETTIREYLEAGADVVTFSGDKLLGGPQAGIIVGKKAYVEPMKKHPLYRALRMDKLTLAALDGTLRLYADEQQAMRAIPVLRMLCANADELATRAKDILRRMRRAFPDNVAVRLVHGHSQVGGGSLPHVMLPTTLVSVSIEGISPQALDERLRTGATPIVGRISQGEFLLDLRTIDDGEIPEVISAIRTLATPQ